MKQYVSWEKVRVGVHEISKEARKRKYSGIYGIPRGGLVPAVMLSHKLKVPLLSTLSEVKNVLIVDDISDTGKTLLEFKKRGYDIATLFYKEGSLVKPNFWKYKKDTDWIVFPWESDWVKQ